MNETMRIAFFCTLAVGATVAAVELAHVHAASGKQEQVICSPLCVLLPKEWRNPPRYTRNGSYTYQQQCTLNEQTGRSEDCYSLAKFQDIDVSWDGKTWWHLIGDLCRAGLLKSPTAGCDPKTSGNACE